jgi:hypothetical protein
MLDQDTVLQAALFLGELEPEFVLIHVPNPMHFN